VLPRSRSSGVNVPFAAVVTALVLVLALILVLIFLALHR
jgi:flagellar biogenesis protein FliO